MGVSFKFSRRDERDGGGGFSGLLLEFGRAIDLWDFDIHQRFDGKIGQIGCFRAGRAVCRSNIKRDTERKKNEYSTDNMGVQRHYKPMLDEWSAPGVIHALARQDAVACGIFKRVSRYLKKETRDARFASSK